MSNFYFSLVIKELLIRSDVICLFTCLSSLFLRHSLHTQHADLRTLPFRPRSTPAIVVFGHWYAGIFRDTVHESIWNVGFVDNDFA